MNIKDYRDKELKYYAIALGLMVFVLVLEDDVLIDFEQILLAVLESSIACSVVGTMAFVMDSVYTPWAKEFLTFFCFTKKPGMKIFSRIKDGKLKDDRIDLAEACREYETIIKAIPETCKGDRYHYENIQWYKIYSKHEKEAKVETANRDYLLCRDLCVETVSTAIVLLFLMAVGVIPFRKIPYLGLILLYVLTLYSTHNKAERLCTNVIAVDLKNKREETKYGL